MNFSAEYLTDGFRKNYKEALAAKERGDLVRAKDKFRLAADYLEKLAAISEGEKREENLRNAARLRAVAEAIHVDNCRNIYEDGVGASAVYSPETDGSPAHIYPIDIEDRGEALPAGMEQYFTFYRPNDLCGFDNVIGLEDAKAAVKEYVIDPILYPQAYNYSFLDNKAILLEGPPGTGKTTFAKAVAHEIHQPFALVNVAALVNCYIGETGKNIDKVFAFLRSYAEKHECGITVFFDELDEIAKRRGGEDKASEAAVPALLRNLDGVKGNKAFLILANTNRKDVLDPAIAERFRKLIFIPLPDEKTRRKLFESKLSDVEPQFFEELGLAHAAEISEGLSGRDITFLCDDLKYYLAKIKAGLIERAGIAEHLVRLIEERKSAKI